MEQIIMTKPNGTSYPLASKRTATKISSAKQTMQLLGDDVVNINVVSPFPQTYGIGDYTTIFGRVYKINQLPKLKKTGMHDFSYDITLEGIQYDLLRIIYELNINTTTNILQDVQGDALTGDLRMFATVLFANANRVFPGKWVLGLCPDTETKTLTFSENDNCLSVMQSLCQESNFNCEYEIEQNNGINTVNFVEKVGQVFPYTFEFGKGKGLYSLDRQNVSSSSIVTRLFVFGSSSNITSKYRAKRLCLPGKSKAQSFIEDANAIANYGVIEGKKYMDEVKPTFKGSITSLVSGSVLEFIDTKMFDLNTLEADGKTTKYLIDGVTAKIHFNTGNLAGYEFEIAKYDHSTHKITLKKQTDDRGDVFPSASSSAFQFAKGDEYKILDVALPESYEQDAEAELQEKGTTYYNQNSQPKVKYGLNVTKSFLEKKFGSDGTIVNVFMPGDYIPVKDADIDVDKSVRIQSFVRDLLDEYNYQLTISDTVTTTTINRVISDLIDIDKIISINDLKDPARAKANWRSSREVLDMVFDPDGDYYTDKIKPNSIDTMCLSVGAKSMQFGLQNTSFQPNFQGNANVVKVTGGVLTHYTIVEDGTKSWVLADNQTTLNENVAFYIYAKCSKTGTSGSIIFNKQAIKVEEDASNYHFLIGVLNSVDPTFNVRSIYLQYGFTMINGRFIKTGRIESADGTTYFDLDNSEIGGRIVFTSNGQEKTLTELGNEALESKKKAIDAYNKASTAQDTADGKRRVFVATPYPPYDIGDLWVNGTDLRRCATAKASGVSYSVNDWVTCVAYDCTKTVIDGGLVTSGTIQVAGSSSTILAGMTGQGTAASSIRFWAGARFENRATAPFRVMQDGSVVMTKAKVDGEIHASSGTFKNGTFENVMVYGSFRNPFVQPGDSFDSDYSDNAALLSTGGGWLNAYSLPWDTKQNGRRITLTNYMFDGVQSYGSAAISAPTGKYFYENGVSKSELRLSREVVVLLGYGDSTKFMGWIVLQRINLMTSYSYGRKLNCLAQGVVTGTNQSASLKYISFDGKTMSVSRLGEGRYRVYIPSNWINSASDYIVMMTGLGYSYGSSSAPIKPSLVARTTSYFDVDMSDDANRNDGSFMFIILNMNDWT